MWWYGEGSPSGWTYALMTLSMILFWGLIIYGVVWLLRYSGRDDAPEARKPTPEDLLAERFARGEIDEPEYRQRLETLRHHRLPTAPL
ncbi:SHOCT domain-containing protein [Blastococcus sp. TF02-8]|uniref:SHOCT domain-containing protein n=1 Tax=Blastococcus sp. TF02-8 TaxID=2250574 RepID=UPI001F0CC7BB|nr:SHOCT domain-containing protein [Blastococcus sp. TF02-8]